MNKSVNTIRSLAIDMIDNAKSGHPGIAMGASPIVYALFKDHMNLTIDHPTWINRDRFVLSAGHGSSMLYALYHLLGFDITIDDLKQFRQIGSKTPGHPEYLDVPGVEATTGPLGQGISMGVGMALASKKLAEKFNTPDAKVFDNYTYVLCGDGDLEEGISYEACSFAGNNKLDNLIVLYDSNGITLDGELALSFNENIKMRFEAQNWGYILVEDGEDINAISAAISKAKTYNQPVIIEVKTTIGYGSKLAGTNKVHGAPLASDDIASVKELYQMSDIPFSVDESVYDDFRTISYKGNEAYAKWLETVESLKTSSEYDLLQRIINHEKVDFKLTAINETLPSRKSSQMALSQLANQEQLLLTGSADLFASNLTNVNDDWQNIYYGIREFAMGGIANGINLYASQPVFISTFLVFSDYLKAAIRLASLMHLPINYVFTHDSIFVGEDGPTHQPIEQLATFRSMPNVNVYRPCDANEVLACYKLAYNSTTTPNILCMSRQDLAPVSGDDVDVVHSNVSRGGYVIYRPESFDKTIIATGSEVQLAIEIAKELGNVRVVSMPCVELFFEQDQQYIDMIMGDKDNNYVIEFASTYGWDRFVNNHNHIIGIDSYGMSGKASDVVSALKLDKESIKQRINHA